MPFAQFGTDAERFFVVYDELTIPPDQLKAWQQDRAGCVVGRKLAEDLKLKVGDLLPLKGVLYRFDLNLTIRGVYDGSPDSGRWCIFHWVYLEEGLKRDFGGKGAGNAGLILAKVKSGALMPVVSRKIDDAYRASDAPTRTQTEAAFSAMIAEMWGDLRGFIGDVGLAVVFALICVAGNAMAMAMRERTTEVAVLRAIGFGKSVIVSMVLTESVLVSGLGGVFGALGAKLIFDRFDVAPYTAGFLSYFSVPWPTALLGLAASLLIGFASGIIPAVRAAQLPVVTGLRKVI
jgi:putative ABC transport system permease protein